MEKRTSTTIVLGLALALSACNPTEQAQSVEDDWIAEPTPNNSAPAPTPTVDASGLYTGPAEVAKYVQKFVNDGQVQGKNVTPAMENPKLVIQIASLNSYGSSTIGLCETSRSLRRVTFDPDFWDSVSETQRELLAHHELGHCVLSRPHRSELLSNGKYSSIMYPIIMSTSTYQGNYDYYQEELFSYNAAVSEEDLNSNKIHICNLEDL